ncbi:MAG: heme exporter protein CcmD [Pseudomonadaceae bacterium]|nr:heme exporter protein CcmD [Pseudomonadaceae bacterium]
MSNQLSGLDRVFVELGEWLCGFGDGACMSGYGAYVWLSVLVTVVAIAINIWLPIRARRRWLARQRDEHELRAAQASGDRADA